MERRSGAKGSWNSHMRRTQSRESMSQELSRVREAAATGKERFYSIVPPADSRSTGSRIPLPEQESGRRSGWHQVDGLRRKPKNNITDLHRRLHQGYRGAARQASLHPKSGWKTNRSNIASLEDKIVSMRW